MDTDWSDWRAFPDPRHKGILVAPFGPGCYEVRHRGTGSLVLFGTAGHTAQRITSLLPEPHGAGTRINTAKRRYCLENIEDLEYRTLACATKEDAARAERFLKATPGAYVFGT